MARKSTTLAAVPPPGTVEFHPLANAFPLMEGDAFRDLVDDIKANGLRESIWLHEDRIVDGRNRYRACLEAGIAPHFRDWSGEGSLIAFVVSLNLHRRHMDDSQKAMAAARLANLRREDTLKRGSAPDPPIGGSGISQADAAALLDVSPKAVERAASVIKHAVPELVAAVDRGEIAISAAAEVASLPEDEQQDLIAEGAKAVRARAKELREESAAAKPEPEAKPFDDAAAAERLRDLVKGEARKWPKAAHGFLLMELENLIQTIKSGAF